MTREPKPAEFYDAAFRESEAYRKPYDDSVYTPLWEQAAQMLLAAGTTQILDLGCGHGRFAQMLRAKAGPESTLNYLGLDFSSEALELARAACPEFVFKHFDLDYMVFLERALPGPYDAVVALEVLEHLVHDEALVALIRPGTLVVLSVPNFESVSHVRWFSTAEDVRARYAPWIELDGLDMLTLGRKAQIYLAHGWRR